MKLIQVDDTKPELKKKIKALYLDAFPKEERKPYEIMEQKQQEGKMQIWAIIQETSKSEIDFCGLAITILSEDIVLLDYFAICPNQRGKGMGSKALEVIKEMYAKYNLILEIESTSEKKLSLSEEEKHIRKRRKKFYYQNGIKEIGLEVVLYGVPMEVLSTGRKIGFKEYLCLYTDTFGEKVTTKIERSYET